MCNYWDKSWTCVRTRACENPSEAEESRMRGLQLSFLGVILAGVTLSCQFGHTVKGPGCLGTSCDAVATSFHLSLLALQKEPTKEKPATQTCLSSQT